MGLIAWFKKKGGESAGELPPPAPGLLPLTPEFDSDQHQAYVDRLDAALGDSSIRNIALTGRYGAGKSSVLQKLAQLHPDRVLMLSLSTLGPSVADESSTNQIEKELVKQLLHSRPARDLPQSRYRRIVPLSVRRAAAGSSAQLAVIGGLLWFLGVFPRVADLPGVDGVLGRVVTLVLFAGLALAVLTSVRLAVHNRVISSISAAGASVTLTNKADTYFDEYLDEIVYYFQTVDVDVVVLEDLDRFNDPRIFEALRELNALLNAALASRGRSIQFVYALKDSIFEQLGHDTALVVDDAAGAEAVRANRTKFFDLVVPVVPFITHRTSRDLLTKLLAEESLVPVSPELIDLTARHITDMRLLKNIRNEYAVFAERLITKKKGIDKLSADSVFAMMVYKNLHLADFEQVQLGRSNLDLLYRSSRKLVAQSLAKRREQLRRIADSTALADVLEAKADSYGARLERFVEMVRAAAHSGYHVRSYTVGGQIMNPSAVRTAVFWRTAYDHQSDVSVSFAASYQPEQTVTVKYDDLREVLAGEADPADWDARERKILESERDQLVAQVELLRKAAFSDLCGRPDFTITHGGIDESFEQIVTNTLTSEVARDLVRHGFIDQNFALYVAQYYGERVSMQAMNFIVQHVQPNVPDPNYSFATPEDIAGVLRETKSRFLDQECAYNIALLDYLLEYKNEGASIVLERLARIDGPAEVSFLAAYLGEGKQAHAAVRQLAETWPQIFDRLVTLDLAHQRRLELVDEAAAHTGRSNVLDVTPAVSDFFHRHYEEFKCLHAPSRQQIGLNALRTLTRVGIVVEDLAVLDPSLVPLAVNADIYRVTAGNLRIVLRDPATLSLDSIAAISPGVLKDCIANPSDYLAAVQTDRATTATIVNPARFAEIVAQMKDWPDEFVVTACRAASKDCRVLDLQQVPAGVWPALAITRRFPATLQNVVAYMDEAEGIDQELGEVLADAGLITQVDSGADDATKLRLAQAILRSSVTIGRARLRVQLVASLELGRVLEPSQVEPETGPLLGELLRQKVCEDTMDLFRRFAFDDWETLQYGIEHSKSFVDFVVPELLEPDMVEQLLTSTTIDLRVQQVVMDRLAEFVPDGGPSVLRAAGQFALDEELRLDVERLIMIATATGDGLLLMRLIAQAGTTLSTAEIVTALVALGGDYRRLAEPSAEIFLPKDQYHSVVLQRLQRDGRLSRMTSRRGKTPGWTVVVAP